MSFLYTQNVMCKFPTHTSGRRQGGQFHLLNTLPKWEPSLMFATFLDASAPILGRGITRLVPEPVFCGVSPVPWHLQHFLVDPQQEIFMPEDSTLASLS